MNIILLGAPGSGKGTQAEKLVERDGFEQFSTGDLFRTNIANKTPLGIEAEKIINAGKLVPDDITNKMVKEALQKKHDQLIFDGYPRTIDQAKALNKMLNELGTKIDQVVYIDVAKDILLERIAGRLICPLCKRSYHKTMRKPKVDNVCDFDQTPLVRRPDDEPEKVAVRLDAYEKQTAPLIDFYKNIELVIHIQAHEMNGEEVYELVKKGMKK